MNKQKKRQNGITLISLVISIIVMLILAGVTLNAVVGDNGIITRTQEATILEKLATLKENIDLKILNIKLDNDLQDVILSDFCIDQFPNTGFLRRVNYKSGETYVIDMEYIDRISTQLSETLTGGDGVNGSIYQLKDVYGINADFSCWYIDESGKMYGVDGIKEVAIDPNARVNMSNALQQSAGIENATVGDTRGKSKLIIDGATSTDILSNLDELYLFPNITELTLKNLNLSDIEGLQYLINLQKIWFDNTQVADYSGLRFASSVDGMYVINGSATESNIVAITNQMENMSSLKVVNFRNNSALTKIPALETLGTIEELRIEENANLVNIYGLSTVKNQSNLTTLYLNENNLTDIVITTETNEKYGYVVPLINDTNVINMSYISGYSNLTNLQLTYIGNGYGTFHEDGTMDGYLRDNKNLKYLAGVTEGGEVKGINNLTKLTRLDMYGCDILNLDALSSFQDMSTNPITYLDVRLSSNIPSAEISDLKNLLSKINKLYIDGKYNMMLEAKENWDLSNSNITDLSFLEGNTVTKVLNLAHNNITDETVHYLKSMTQLTSLNLSYNSQITDFSFLSGLTNLRALDCHGLKITQDDLMLIPNKEKLASLWLFGCTNMTSIEWLEYFPNLTGMFDMTNWKISANADLSIFDTRDKKFDTIRTNRGDLTTMQKQISVLNKALKLHLRGDTSMLAKLSNCTEITYLGMDAGSEYANDNYFNGENTLDLSKCTKLQQIEFRRNAIENLIMPANNETEKNALSKITVFDMNKGTEWAIPDFSENNSLEYINLNKNYISQTNFVTFIDQITPKYDEITNELISGCPNLNTLYLNNNKLTSLEPLLTLAEKTAELAIYVPDNQIVTLSGIENLTQLTSLDIQNNPGITNIQPIIDLKNNPDSKLNTVSIRNCTGILSNSENITTLKDLGLTVIE